jgi:hypothetical protein
MELVANLVALGDEVGEGGENVQRKRHNLRLGLGRSVEIAA